MTTSGLAPSPRPAAAPLAREPLLEAVARGLGGALGAFGLLNLAGEALAPGFSANFLWVSAPPALVGLAGAGLLAHAWRPLRGGAARTAGTLALLLGGWAWRDALDFARVLAAGRVATPAWIPGSLAIAAVATGLACSLLRGSARAHPGRRLPAAAGLAGGLLALPLLFVLTFGPTRYARPADCAVVLGARVYADGTPSLALADRTDEAIRLYRARLVRRLILSGGIDPVHGRSEAEAMRERALAAGVPDAALLLDEAGDDSAATARNSARLMRAHGLASALVVSHYYHEPRLKLLFARAGVRAWTVPARMSRRLVLEPWFVTRELAAFYAALVLDTPGRLK
ncbi:MAG: YdcF family protein [Planctomycetota bacterium]